ncbi:hypothetical protein, partial [Teichococcus oryzae]|uniref:hypothetical protein n=1 Tax=Teichococcus oryzae TaxID=1608942 RepID=UPI0019D5D4F7
KPDRQNKAIQPSLYSRKPDAILNERGGYLVLGSKAVKLFFPPRRFHLPDYFAALKNHLVPARQFFKRTWRPAASSAPTGATSTAGGGF